MTRDEVLAMAEQAGGKLLEGVALYVGRYHISTQFLERFAALAFEAGRKAAEQDRVDAVCQWEQDDEGGYWQTQCGEAFEIIEGTPEQNGMKYCHYCGKTLSARSENET